LVAFGCALVSSFGSFVAFVGAKFVDFVGIIVAAVEPLVEHVAVVASVAVGLVVAVVVAAVVAELMHVLFVHGFSLIRTWLT